MTYKKWMSKLSLVLATVIVASLLIQAPVYHASIQAESNASPDITPPSIASTDTGNPKLESALSQLVEASAQGQPTAFAQENGIDLEANKVKVVIEAKADNIQAAITAAQDAGGDVETSYENLIQVMIPLSSLSDLANNSGINCIRLPFKPITDATPLESMTLINATAWNSAGYNGSGVKIGILDVGFYNYSALLGTAVANFSWSYGIGGSGTDPHGTACAEVIHDIAPNASLYLATCDTDINASYAVNWLISQNVSIISCSLSWLIDGPGDGTGTIDSVVNNASAAGILWVTSAGNYAWGHWMGTCNDTTPSNPTSNFSALSWLNFSSGSQTDGFTTTAGANISIGLRWNDSWGNSSNNYDLYLLNSSFQLVAWSNTSQTGKQGDDPVEVINIYNANDTQYYIKIAKYNATGTSQLDLFINFPNSLSSKNLAYSLLPPADSPNAMTVGAVDWNYPTEIEYFSSRGPTTDSRTKPEIVAPDRVSTVSLGDGNFTGTSAAAPHVAGAAALVKQRYPAYNRSQIQSYLENNAVPLDPSYSDPNISGSGRLDLQNAYAYSHCHRGNTCLHLYKHKRNKAVRRQRQLLRRLLP